MSSPEDVPVNLGDTAVLKSTMDERATKVLVQQLGVQEDFSASNQKIALGVAATIVAMCAQFAEHLFNLPFPQSRPLLFVCVCLYFILHARFQSLYYTSYHNAFFLSKPHKQAIAGVYAKSTLPRFQTTYTLTFTRRDNPKITQSTPLQITDFFDVQGHFLKGRFDDRLTEVWREFEATLPTAASNSSSVDKKRS